MEAQSLTLPPMPQGPPTDQRASFSQVVLASGHMIDLPGRARPRFPPSAVPAITEAMAEALVDWNVGSGTLLISGGARGSDIIAAEQALALGAEAWLLLALADDEFLEASVRLPGTDWEARFRSLRDRCPTWFQADHLGPPPPGEDVFERNNDWCLAVARAQAGKGMARVLAVWDGRAGDGRGGTFHLVEMARSLGLPLKVVPLPADRSSPERSGPA